MYSVYKNTFFYLLISGISLTSAPLYAEHASPPSSGTASSTDQQTALANELIQRIRLMETSEWRKGKDISDDPQLRALQSIEIGLANPSEKNKGIFSMLRGPTYDNQPKKLTDSDRAAILDVIHIMTAIKEKEIYAAEHFNTDEKIRNTLRMIEARDNQAAAQYGTFRTKGNWTIKEKLRMVAAILVQEEFSKPESFIGNEERQKIDPYIISQRVHLLGDIFDPIKPQDDADNYKIVKAGVQLREVEDFSEKLLAHIFEENIKEK